MFRAKHLTTGKTGEKIAEEFLAEIGYSVLGTNLRRPWGEIDIVSKDRKGKIVFVEVKTMRQNTFANQADNELTPEDNMTKSKLKKLRKTCQYFANLYPKLISEEGWQIDLVAIMIKNENHLLTKGDKNYLIKHYPNISF